MACPSQIPMVSTVSAGMPDSKALVALVPLGQLLACLKLILVLEVWATEVSPERPIPMSLDSRRDNGQLTLILTTLIIGEVSEEYFCCFQF
jgi:hypothetical protein